MRIHKVEQGSDQWKRLKLGKISGTRIKDVFKSDNLSLVDELIAESISDEIEEDVFINEAMQRGIDYEPLARISYELRTGLITEQFGFLQHSEYDWLGISPDGLIKSENGKYEKAIEIKCPSTSTHVKYIRQNTLPNEYKYQIYGYFLICQDLQELDFISYDTRFNIKPMHVITITRESIEKELESTMIGLLKFYAKYEEYYKQVTF